MAVSREDVLRWRVILGPEHGSQRCMPPLQLVQRQLQRTNVEGPLEPDVETHVQDSRSRRQLLEEPQTTLYGRQRIVFRARSGHQLKRGFSVSSRHRRVKRFPRQQRQELRLAPANLRAKQLVEHVSGGRTPQPVAVCGQNNTKAAKFVQKLDCGHFGRGPGSLLPQLLA